MFLVYQSLGVVYGDLSIFFLYVFKSIFVEDIYYLEFNEEILGVFFCVFWIFILVFFFKYVFIVFRVDDNGEGKYLNILILFKFYIQGIFNC